MPASTITTTIDDTTFQSGNNARLIATSVGAGFTITKIQIVGSLNFQSFNPATTGFAFQSYVEVGIQYGNHGYPPVGVVGSPDSSAWLLHQHVYPSPSIAVYPSTGTSVIADRYPFDITWRGQLPLTALSDFYFSDGSMLGSGVDNWKMTANTRLWYY
jgi:hypothetical protein